MLFVDFIKFHREDLGEEPQLSGVLQLPARHISAQITCLRAAKNFFTKSLLVAINITQFALKCNGRTIVLLIH